MVMSRDMDTEFIEQIKRKHIGKWIALKDHQVVAVSDSHKELFKQLKEKNVDGFEVIYSPTERQKRYGFLFCA